MKKAQSTHATPAPASQGADTCCVDRTARYLLFFCLSVYAVHAVYATATHRHLYGDAAWFLVRIISEGQVTGFVSSFLAEFYYSRFVAYALTQLPAVAAARLGVDDWQALSWVLGATFFLHKPLSIIACYVLLPTGRKLVIVFPVLAVFAGTINSEIYIVTETHIAASLYWPLLIAISLWQRPTTGFFIACVISCLALAFSYESMAFLGAALCMVAFARLLFAEKGQRVGWAWLLLATFVPIVINWMAILLPRDPTNKTAFTDGLLTLWNHSTTALSTLHAGAFASVLALLILGMTLIFGRASSRFQNLLLLLMAFVLATFPLLHFLNFSEQVDFSHSITDRGFGGLVVQALLVPVFLLGVVTGFERLRVHGVGVALLVSALAAGQVAWQIMATRSWDYALNSASVVLQEQRGQIICSSDSLPHSPELKGLAPASSILCHWWVMPLSVLLAPEGRVNALLLSTQSFRPFDPLDPGSLPSMQHAPVDYRPLLSEGLRGQTVRSGEAISFAAGGRGLRLVGRGFSHPEDWAIWTDGAQAELFLCVVGSGLQEATFTLVPFVNDARPILDAEILLNGEPAARWRFVAGETMTKRSVVMGVGAKAGSGGCTQMVIRFDDARQASELSAEGDPRRLGLAFIRLAIRSAGN